MAPNGATQIIIPATSRPKVSANQETATYESYQDHAQPSGEQHVLQQTTLTQDSHRKSSRQLETPWPGTPVNCFVDNMHLQLTMDKDPAGAPGANRSVRQISSRTPHQERKPSLSHHSPATSHSMAASVSDDHVSLLLNSTAATQRTLGPRRNS